MIKALWILMLIIMLAIVGITVFKYKEHQRKSKEPQKSLTCSSEQKAKAIKTSPPAPEIKSKKIEWAVIKPLPQTDSNKVFRKTSDLGTLAEGLEKYLDFNQNLKCLSPTGLESKPDFVRDTKAFMPDLTEVDEMEARFFPGKFGKSVFIEYGRCSCNLKAGENLLSPDLALAESEAGFEALKDSKLSKTPGIEGQNCLKISGTGFKTPPEQIEVSELMAFSLYVKGPKDKKFTFGQVEGASKTVELSGEWQRLEINLEFKIPPKKPITDKSKKPEPYLKKLSFFAKLEAPGTFFADALMLENIKGGYSRPLQASSWLPPGCERPGDRLVLPGPNDFKSGTISLWFKPIGNFHWRRLLCIGKGHGWQPNLAVDLKDNNVLAMIVEGNKQKLQKTLNAPLNDGKWHHLTVAWNGKEVAVYLDWKRELFSDKIPETDLPGPITIGGVDSNFSPGVRANSCFDEYAQWNRPLNEQEIFKLFNMQKPLSTGFNSSITLEDYEKLSVYPRDYLNRFWKFSLKNNIGNKLSDITVSWGIKGISQKQKKLSSLPKNSLADLSLEWFPALLMPGKYDFFVKVDYPNSSKNYEKQIEITPARVPKENVQVINWGGLDKEYKDLGFTTAGISGRELGPNPFDIAIANRNGMYTMMRQNIHGKASSPDDYMLNLAGESHNVDQKAEKPLASLKRQAKVLGESLKNFPDVRYMIINTEHLWINGLDFRKSTIKKVMKMFGLDLNNWLNHPKDKHWAVTPPGGRLAPAWGNYPMPADRIVTAKDSLYAFMRWWHSDKAGNEIFLNDLVAKTVKKSVPSLNTIAEPVLRRPAVRAFKSQDIIEEWFYFPNPLVAISIQEKLTAAKRGTKAQIAGMPQFLFKPGWGAAPYRSMPPPHLYRETMWNCIARPLRIFTFWGAWMAIHKDKTSMTQEEIDAFLKKRLGKKKITIKSVRENIEIEGEHSEISLFIPELKGEIDHMLNGVVKPLGALLPKWQNRPRQIAVYVSFAGQLFSAIRWGRMPKVLEAMPYPYDVIYDQDFEENPELLKGYDLVILSECAAIIEPAAKQLEKFARRGGMLLADEHYQGKIKDVITINYGSISSKTEKILKDKRLELLKLYGDPRHPQFIEGMEQATAELNIGTQPVEQALQIIQMRFRPRITVSGKQVHFNTLHARGANYLVAVNDLRVPGKYFGNYNTVLEKGLPQSAEFNFKESPGKIAYELLSGKELDLKTFDKKSNLKVDLPPAGGKVVVFLPEKIDKIDIELPAAIKTGKILEIKANLRGESGEIIPGIIPAKIEITRPDKSLDSFSCYSAFESGELRIKLPIPFNAPSGDWQIKIKELASLKEKVKIIHLP
jgi:hypothetical protein